MELLENQTIMLDDGNKYWIVKKRNIDGIIFYFSIKTSKPAQIIVFAEVENELQIVEDEEILKIATIELASSLTEPQE